MPTFATDILDIMATTTSTFVVGFVTDYWVYILSIGVILYFGRLLMKVAKGH